MRKVKNNADLCSYCGEMICKADKDSKFHWFCCDVCNLWCHGFCGNIRSDEVYAEMVAKPKWICPKCITESNFEVLQVQLIKSFKDSQIDNNKNSLKPISSSSVTEDKSTNANKVRGKQKGKKAEVTKTDCNSDELLLLVRDQLKFLWPDLISDVASKLKTEMSLNIIELENRVKDLEQKMEHHNNYSYSKNIIISNVPDTVDVYNYDFLKVIASTIDDKNFDLNSIEKVVRMRSPDNSNKCMPIIVTFSNLRIRNNFINTYWKFRNLNNQKLSIKCLDINFPNESLYINDHLSKAVFKIYMKAKQMKKNNFLSGVHLRSGKVVVVQCQNGTPEVIRTLKDLMQFENSFSNETLLSSTVIKGSNPARYN